MEDPTPELNQRTAYDHIVSAYLLLSEENKETLEGKKMALKYLAELEKAYPHFTSVMDEHSIDILMLLADGCRYTKNYQRQYDLVGTALKISVKMYGATHSTVGEMYGVLSLICKDLGRIKEAETCRSLAERIKALQKNAKRMAKLGMMPAPSEGEEDYPDMQAAIAASLLVDNQRRSPSQSCSKRFQ